MDDLERLSTKTRKPFTDHLWDALTVFTYPCHLPILAVVLAGATTDTFIGRHWGIATPMLTSSLVLSVARLLRAFRGGSRRPHTPPDRQ